MREKFNYYMEHYDLVEDILKNGAERARQIAKERLLEVRKAIGVE